MRVAHLAGDAGADPAAPELDAGQRGRGPCATGAASEISNLIYNSGASLTENLRSEVSIFYQ